MNTTPPVITPREQASLLVNAYASKSALLEAATADTRAQITALTAALNKAAASHLLELDQIEAQAKALALEHGEEIFGDKRSLIENGYKLALTATDEVEIDGGEEAACQRIKRAFAELGSADDAATRCARLALNACLIVTTKINRTYVRDQYDAAPEWFEDLGLRLIDKDSASLKKAPPPRVAKPAATKTTKRKAAAPPLEQEAA
jgi:hypothetical protein